MILKSTIIDGAGSLQIAHAYMQSHKWCPLCKDISISLLYSYDQQTLNNMLVMRSFIQLLKMTIHYNFNMSLTILLNDQMNAKVTCFQFQLM